MNYPTDDLAALDEAIIAWRVSCLAEVARRDGTISNRRLPVIVEPDDDLIDVPDYRPHRNVTVTPVEYFDDRTWWERGDKFVLALRTLGALMAIALCLGLVWVVVFIVSAVTTALATAIPALLGVAALVALIMLLASMGSGGGRGFSGTFNGRMH